MDKAAADLMEAASQRRAYCGTCWCGKVGNYLFNRREWRCGEHRKSEVPEDEVKAHHRVIHAHLIRWGLWAASRARNRSLASIEGLYTKYGTPPSTAPISADPQIMEIERAVYLLPEEHRRTVCMYYVYRFEAVSICQKLKMRFEAWPEHIATCRAMVVNLLRRYGRV